MLLPYTLYVRLDSASEVVASSSEIVASSSEVGWDLPTFQSMQILHPISAKPVSHGTESGDRKAIDNLQKIIVVRPRVFQDQNMWGRCQQDPNQHY